MTSNDPAIDHYHSLRPRAFEYIARLELQQAREAGIWRFDLQIELYATDESNPQRLQLSFIGVRDFKYVPASAFDLSVSLLEIVSIADRQWEGVHYQVFNDEQDADLSFYCFDFSAVLLK